MLSGLFHSIGKLYMPADILDKPGKLTDQEQLTIHQYPEKGYEILCQSGLQGETEIVDGIRQHHERGDGSGYPHKRKMDKIGIFGRIIGILDVYDAMTANRVYAKRKSPFEAFDALLADMMAGKLDATYGVLFVKKVCQALIGSWVRLSNGKKAKIIYIDQSRTSALPIVETEDGNFWDIATKQGVSITCLLTYDELFTH
jgi:metal dependent phosphohydrolase